MMKSLNKKNYVLATLIGVLILSICLSLAYFSANVLGEGTTNATVSTENVAQFKFTKDGDLAINATMSSFSENGGNLSDTVNPYVTLTTESAYSDSYSVYFDISENDFVYTQDSSTPELILEITNPDGTKVTEIDGLDYVTSGDVAGFDITTTSGSFKVAKNYTIASTDNELIVTQDWEFTLYFINLDTNQNENTGKTLSSEIIMQKDGDTFIYYENDNGEYTQIAYESFLSDGYAFNEELSYCDNNATISWDEDSNEVVKSNESANCYAYFEIYNIYVDIELVILTNSIGEGYYGYVADADYSIAEYITVKDINYYNDLEEYINSENYSSDYGLEMLYYEGQETFIECYTYTALSNSEDLMEYEMIGFLGIDIDEYYLDSAMGKYGGAIYLNFYSNIDLLAEDIVVFYFEDTVWHQSEYISLYDEDIYQINTYSGSILVFQRK